MDRFVYAVSVRLFRPIRMIAGEWPYSREMVIVTLDLPVRDNDDLRVLHAEVRQELFRLSMVHIPERSLDILGIHPISHFNTKFPDKWLQAKERTREDEERGHPYWWKPSGWKPREEQV